MTTPPRLAEGLLSLLGAPGTLLGDLQEAVASRSRLWYWRQVGAYVVVATCQGLARHPLRALWWTTATTVVAVALTHSARLRAQPASGDALRAEVETSGWIADHADGGGLRAVPALRVRVRNMSGDAVAGVQVTTVFRRATDGVEWGNDWRPLVHREALPPGASSQVVVARSAHGLVGPATLDEVLRHPSFVDARVEVFARHGARSWARLAELPVRRQRLEP